MKDTINILVIDDSLKEEDPLLMDLSAEYKQALLFNNSQEALSYINDNLENKMIVILDIRLGERSSNGHEILKKIREKTKLIPVIIWSAYDGREEDFSDFVNNDAFYYVSKSADSEYLYSIIGNAANRLRLDLATNIEDWVLRNYTKKDQIILLDRNGEHYTAQDLIKAIRTQTSFGIEIQEKMLQMTIDLFLDKKSSEPISGTKE